MNNDTNNINKASKIMMKTRIIILSILSNNDDNKT